jgi:hypothetical protein
MQEPHFIDTRVDVEDNKKREKKNRKLFSLAAMEILIDKISFLRHKYDKLSINAQERLGYHYNEILNILLFNKYVKKNKNLFKYYKKIKSLVNRGLKFKKRKIHEMENKINTKLADPNYTHFAILKDNNKILFAWNYSDIDKDELRKFPKDYFVKDLKQMFPDIPIKNISIKNKVTLSRENFDISDETNWYKSIDESTTSSSVFGGDGFPIMRGVFNMSPNQKMFNPPMNPNVKNGMNKYGGKFVNPNTEKHSYGGKPLQESYDEDDYNEYAPSNFPSSYKREFDIDDVINYVGKEQWDTFTDEEKKEAVDHYKSIEKINESEIKEDHIKTSDREGMIKFIHKNSDLLKTQYSMRELQQFSSMRLKKLYDNIENKMESKKLNEDKKPSAIINIENLHKENQKNSKTYYKKEASEATNSLVNGKEYKPEFEKDSLKKEDIPMYDNTEGNKDYLEKIHRGLEDFEPEKEDKVWLERFKELAGDEVFKNAKKRKEAKDKYKLGTTKPVLTKNFDPKVPDSDKLLKENIQSFYVDSRNNKKFVIFNSNDIEKLNEQEENKNLVPLNYKGFGQILSESFIEDFKNKTLFFDIKTKKIYTN